MIKAVLFDMDGVLIESEIEYMNRFEKIYKIKNIPIAREDLYALIGKSEDDSIDILSNLSLPICHGQEIMDLCNKDIKEFPFNHRDIRTENIYELFHDLKEKGYKIAVASATNRKGIEKALEETELAPFVDTFYSGCDCARSKPYPDVYLKVMELLGVDAKECAILEDSNPGIRAAHASGGYVIAREVEVFPIDQSLASKRIQDVYEVLAIVEELNK